MLSQLMRLHHRCCNGLLMAADTGGAVPYYVCHSFEDCSLHLLDEA